MKNFLLASSLVALWVTSAWAQEQMKTLELPSECTAILGYEVRKTVGNIQTWVYDVLFCYWKNNPTWVEMTPATMLMYGEEIQQTWRKYAPFLKPGDLKKLQTNERSRGKIWKTREAGGWTFFEVTKWRVWFVTPTDSQCFQETFTSGKIERNCKAEIPNSWKYSEKWHISFQNIPGRVSFILNWHIADEWYEI